MSPLKDCLRLEISDIVEKEEMRECHPAALSQLYLFPKAVSNQHLLADLTCLADIYFRIRIDRTELSDHEKFGVRVVQVGAGGRRCR